MVPVVTKGGPFTEGTLTIYSNKSINLSQLTGTHSALHCWSCLPFNFPGVSLEAPDNPAGPD